MDEVTLVVSVVEYYSYLKNTPSEKTFKSFLVNGIFPLLLESHKNFPDMDLAFHIGLIDGITSIESDATETGNPNYKERISAISQAARMIMQETGKNVIAACEECYENN